jgi:hypothetical protein
MPISFKDFTGIIGQPIRQVSNNDYVKRVTATFGNNVLNSLDFMNALGKNVQGTILNTSGLLSNSTTFYVIMGLGIFSVGAYGYSKIKN